MYQVNSEANLTAFAGFSISSILAPPFGRSSYQHININCCYLPLQVKKAESPNVVAGIKAFGLVGKNIAISYKDATLAYQDELGSFADEVGATDAVCIVDGKLIGCKTEAVGLMPLPKNDAGFEPQDKRVLIIGSGRAAGAVTITLASEGASRIIFMDRTFERTVQLTNHVVALISRADLVLDATPVGAELGRTSCSCPSRFFPFLAFSC